MNSRVTSPLSHSDNQNGFVSNTFTDEQLAELKECFVMFDGRSSGVIASKDIGPALRAMGQNPSEKDVAQMLQDANLQDVDCLSVNDFLQAVSRYELKDEAVMRDEFTEALRVFDRQDEGQLSAAELKAALLTYGEALTEDDIDDMLTVANVRENGTFDYYEFINKIVSK